MQKSHFATKLQNKIANFVQEKTGKEYCMENEK